MADIRVRVGQPDLHVNVGQQDAIKVLASNSAVVGGIATFATKAGVADTAIYAYFASNASTATLSASVVGGIASVTQLDVTGKSTFVGITTFNNDVYFSGNITGTLTTIDGGRF